MPGGGQEPTKTLEEALHRECLEEINAHIEVGLLRFIREYFFCNHESAAQDNNTHHIEFMFACKLKDGEIPGIGSVPDSDQIGMDWLKLSEIESYRLYPLSMRKLFKDMDNWIITIYLGNIN